MEDVEPEMVEVQKDCEKKLDEERGMRKNGYSRVGSSEWKESAKDPVTEKVCNHHAVG